MARLIAWLVLLAVVVGGCGGDREKSARGADSVSTAVVPDTSAATGAEGDSAGAEDTLSFVPRDTTGAVYRGYVVFQPERTLFTACGSSERSWVVDMSGQKLSEVYERLAMNPGDPVFFELRARIDPAPKTGFGAAYATQLTVFAIRRAALEGPACNEDLRGIEFRARGNEPFWSVDIRRGGILFSDFGRSQRIVFPYVTPTLSGDERQYHAVTGGDQGHEITITIRESECTDSMSGAYFTFTANVEVDGRAYTGCAMEGW